MSRNEVLERVGRENEAEVLRAAQVKPRKRRRRHLWRALLLLAIVAGALGAYEVRTSRFQAQEFSRYASTLSYALLPGPSTAIRYPRDGPFDKRLGYAYLPLALERLQQNAYAIERQARFSAELMEFTRRGFFPPYAEKLPAGLTIADCRGAPLYEYRYPQQHYEGFAAIPPLVVQSLLFIENRGLLDPEQPLKNPAVDWSRLVMATISQAGKILEVEGPSAGGSTLATQLEKYRHSPDGLTSSAGEKLRQLVSASVRAYQRGTQTMATREIIVRDYLNSVPLSAVPGHGEVHGLADGLRVWYGADFDTVNRVLDPRSGAVATDAERGLALRQVLSLMIAQRRPSYYLAQGRKELATLTDSYVRLLAKDGIVDRGLRDAALASPLTFRDWVVQPTVQPIETSKGMRVARRRLASLLRMSLYDLDRLDLSASASLQGELQEAATTYLHQLADPAYAASYGLIGERLLTPTTTQDVRYSFTLYERRADRFSVRVQTDNTDQPFDLNDSSKLELGSTAKLRVLTTYLEIVAELHQRYAGQPPEALREAQANAADRLTRWALEYLSTAAKQDLPAMLEAALDRRYSASPHEGFFTGGGMHTFANFRREDNARIPTVRESLRESINLPFIRLMRDIVRYTIYQTPGNSAQLLADDADPRRSEYLSRFADHEGREFLRRFWRKYQNKATPDQLSAFLDGMRPTPVRLAAVHRFLLPDADRGEFAAFIADRLPNAPLGEAQLDSLYGRYGPDKYSLPDQAYIAKVHPLELWLVGYLIEHPQARFDDAVAASHDTRQQVYGWLFKSRYKRARDSRIGIMLEVEAFLDIHRRWQRVGYPFDHLVPSLATAIGSSGDRPAALAELIGTIQNDGVRLPTERIDAMRFAAGTPYETSLVRTGVAQRVLPSEVAYALRNVLSQVVEGGTARRLHGSFQLADGTPIVMGGKTGTGDNRIEAVGAGGRLLSSTAINRTATFVFYLGPNHFGTLTAFVPGKAAEGYRFTSALPVQVLKGMATILQPYLQPDSETLCKAGVAETEVEAAPPSATP